MAKLEDVFIVEADRQLDLRNTEKANRIINSYLGILSHTASYNIRQDLLLVA